MNTENKIAIDIVLLLPDKINKLARDLSSKIISPENIRPYKLGENDNHYPCIGRQCAL